jgi:hypothetical protein
MPFQIHTLSRIAASVLLAGVAAHAGAAGTVVLDTYPAGEDPFGWPSQVYADASGRQDIAVPFTLTSATSIQSILTSLDGLGGVTLGILGSQGSTPLGGAWLYSTHLTDPVMDTTLSPTGWSLGAGTYWLAAVADTGFDGQWQSGTEDYSGDWAQADATGWTAVTSTFIGMPAARITVDATATAAVPEPGSFALMLAGGLLVAGVARRNSNARQQG